MVDACLECEGVLISICLFCLSNVVLERVFGCCTGSWGVGIRTAVCRVNIMKKSCHVACCCYCFCFFVDAGSAR